MRQKITAGRLWGLISPMVLYMIVQVVVSGIVTFGIIFAAILCYMIMLLFQLKDWHENSRGKYFT